MKIKLIAAFILVTLYSCKQETPKNTITSEAPVSAQKTMSKGDTLSMYVDQNPNDANAWHRRARYYLEQKNLKYAASDIEQALALDSTQADFYLTRGDIFFISNKTRYSRDNWLKCIALSPEHLECRLKLAELFLIVQNYEQSMRYLKQVLEQEPDNSKALFMTGVNLRDLGDTNKAIDYIQKAVDANQTYIEAMDMLGILYAAKGNPLAVSYYQNILNIDPNRADIYYKLGVYYQAKEETNKAIEAYTKAVQLKPDDADSYFNLGYIHVKLQVYDIARNHFANAINSRKDNYKAHYARGYCFEILGDIDNAERDYKIALNIRPDYTLPKEGLNRIAKARSY